MKNLHGHEVIAFILNANPPIKEEELLSTLSKEFKDCRFHTCSKENLTVKGLLDFLKMADKLHFVKGVAKIKTDNVCDDDEQN